MPKRMQMAAIMFLLVLWVPIMVFTGRFGFYELYLCGGFEKSNATPLAIISTIVPGLMVFASLVAWFGVLLDDEDEKDDQ